MPGPRKTVLMVAYSYYESDPRVIREAEAAVSGGFDVDFLALRRPGSEAREEIRGVNVIRLKQAKYRGKNHVRYVADYLEFFVRCFFRTTSLFFKRRYRVIHVNNMPDFLVFTTLIPRLFGCKVILDIHDPMPNTFASKFRVPEGGFFYRMLLLQERLSASYSSKVITVHDPVKDGILVKHGLPADSIGVIANFTDQELFPLRQSTNTGNRIRFVFHGTILERSGLRTLMNALHGLRNRDRITVKIIGEGDFSDTLKELISTMQLESVVEFDNRSYPAHSIWRQLENCDVGLVPLEISSVTDYALPLKLLEYISLGIPVVSVRSYAISYYFDEGDCLFFPWNEPQALTEIMDRIAGHPDVLDRYRQRSKDLRDRFSWAGEKEKYIALLNQLAPA
jgi:glycosyltransferase involved in cell wall biosynthesis